MNRLTLLLAAALGASALSVFAQNVPPTVTTQIADFTEYAGAPARSIDMSNLFSDPDVSDAIRFATDLGDVDIALLGQQKPITVANFLRYVDEGRYFKIDPNTHQPAASFVHRVVPNFVIQGGQWLATVAPGGNLQPTALGALPPIQNEAGISNKRGTIAMAQVGSDQNSATSQWFINVADNGGAPNNLDIRNCASTSNGQVCAGPYTVFGRIGNNTMSVVDAIAAVPWYNFSGVHPSFEHLPLRGWDGSSPIFPSHLVTIPAITHIPVLTLSASSDNANAAVTISGTKLLVQGKSVGTAHITVTATDLDGASVSQQFTVNVLAAPGRPVNLSTRMQVGTGDNALIAGFIMRGPTPKRLAIRGMGPSTGLPGALSNPTLELHDNTGATIATNNNWGDATNKQDVIDLGLAPASPNEAVILTTVPSDANGAAYTAVMRGVSNFTGLGVVEVYDLDSGPGSTLVNISTRGQVGADPNALIGGFIFGGTDSKQVLVRAIGPSLTGFGVPGALSNPTLDFVNAQGTTIDSNDDWTTSPQKTQIQNSGLAPTNSKESAIIQTLAPGNYGAVVHGVGGETGVGSVEIYQLP
ncbi:MAG TPA: peptidylprolyl isomerase [Chthoniobacterales bacterium]|nr:peptidylprolyl isomerase [Chthoniobacterales bacterium]